MLALVSPPTRLLALESKATYRPFELTTAFPLTPLACLPPEVTLTRWVLPEARSWMKMSRRPFVSLLTRLLAPESNTTNRPSDETEGSRLLPFPCAPFEFTLTRVVVPLPRSCTNTSIAPFVSPSTRSDAFDSKATIWPSPEMAGSALCPLLGPPPLSNDTSSVAPLSRSWTKMSHSPLVSSRCQVGGGCVERDMLAALADGRSPARSVRLSAPPDVTLTRSVVLVPWSRTKQS